MDNVEKFISIASSLSDLYKEKNKAYGDSFHTTFEKLGLISAITRISDKTNRLCNLATNKNIDDLGESIEDTLRDLASYCIMTLIEMGDLCKEIVDIRVGDVFLCTNDVVMDDGEKAYQKGYLYMSEKFGCITDDEGVRDHYWGGDCDLNKHFKYASKS